MIWQVGCADILGRIVEDLKDESEPYRRMVMETIDKVVRDLGTADVDARLEELLIDGILYAFQEQVCIYSSPCAPFPKRGFLSDCLLLLYCMELL